MKIRVLIPLLVLASPVGAQERIDLSMIAKIRSEGLERSHVVQMFDTIATVIGPRLTASVAYLRAANFAKQKFAEFGARDARLEPWPFGRGWELDRFSIEMIEPRYMPLLGFPEAWSPSTPGEIVATPVLTAGKSASDVERLAGTIKGGIVMPQGLMANFITSDRIQPTDPAAPPAVAPTTRLPSCTPRPPAGAANPAGGRGGAGGQSPDAQRIAQLISDASPAVRLTATRGLHGSLFLQGGRYNAQPASTNVVLAAEHYNMIVRLVENGVPVKLRVNSQSRFSDRDTNGYNIVAEIPGTDPRLRDQIVMAGAHLDSWHSSLGAADNADGAAVMLEVMRILKAVGVQPRRTIRIALWGGEEEGLLGACAWTRQHLASDSVARSKMSLYLNMDPGTGPIFGFYMEGNDQAKAIFDAWLDPFKDLGYRKNIISGIGSTDHLTFINQGVPGFNPIQDYTDYDTRIHHTNWDSPERVPVAGLKAAAVIYASLLYHAAMRDEMIPRK